jgi:ATP-binding cassette subfamily F protein 3
MMMMQKVTKKFGHRVLLNSISYHFPEKSRVALVGHNGAGKTTLLNILCGFDKDFDGELVKPKALRLGYLPQTFNPEPAGTVLQEAISGARELLSIIAEREEILAKMCQEHTQDIFDRYDYLEQEFQALDGYRLEEDAQEILKGLGFKQEHFHESVQHLSGGWRMRLEFAKILLDRPNFLILDEPTNHLDLPSIEWFESYLKSFHGTILFVSHDKDLLNRLATHVVHLRQGEITPYVGNFDAFLEAFTLARSQNESVAKHLKAQYEHIESFVNRFRVTPTKASMVRSRLKVLARLKVLQENVKIEEIKDTLDLKISNPHPSGKHVLKAEKLSIGYEKPLIKNLSFSLDRGSRLAILGANGLGKTTLLRTLLGLHAPLSGEVVHGHNVTLGYFAQEHLEGLDENLSVLENLKAGASKISDLDARKLLAALGLSGNDVLKQVKVLSGGEKSRTALSCLLAQYPNTLFLDEPTNHLDLSACENLAEALCEYTGTVVFISHNRSFIQTVATHVLYLKDKGPLQVEKCLDFS